MATHSYDNGGQPDGTLDVSIAAFYGEDYVCLDLVNGDSGAHLTAEQALELAADLIAHAKTLRKPPDEDLIRDAMEHAQGHLGIGRAQLDIPVTSSAGSRIGSATVNEDGTGLSVGRQAVGHVPFR